MFLYENVETRLVYDSIKMNKSNGGLHSRVARQCGERTDGRGIVSRGRRFMNRGFMSVSTAARQMLYVENEVRKEGVYNEDSMVVATARVGQEDK